MGTGLVGVIAAGTHEFSFTVYKVPEFKVLTSHKETLALITPKDGWYEQDPREMLVTIHRCCSVGMARIREQGYTERDFDSIGITNQRETTILWDSVTSRPLYNAILWKDERTKPLVEKMLAGHGNNMNAFQRYTGLPISSFFSAFKIRWLIDNIPSVAQSIKDERCKFGTIDSWIIWFLTNGHFHITDVTNASRTMLMNISTLNWDPTMLDEFNICVDIMPMIHSCAEYNGYITREHFPIFGVKICGIIGNQHASLLGQMCVKPGMAKNSYRSGCFFMCNTGERMIRSKNGLITTIGYKLGKQARTIFALEGSFAVAGHAFAFLSKNLRLTSNFRRYAQAAASVPNTGGVYFVPALTGLGAPYWNMTARGLIIGLTQYSTKNHIIRAALESICFQTCDILRSISKDCDFKVDELHADGDMSEDNLLMQLQADLSGIKIIRLNKDEIDTVSLGAAICAAVGAGFYLFDPNSDLLADIPSQTFESKITDEERASRYALWLRAVSRSFGWAKLTSEKKADGDSKKEKKRCVQM